MALGPFTHDKADFCTYCTCPTYRGDVQHLRGEKHKNNVRNYKKGPEKKIDGTIVSVSSKLSPEERAFYDDLSFERKVTEEADYTRKVAVKDEPDFRNPDYDRTYSRSNYKQDESEWAPKTHPYKSRPCPFYKQGNCRYGAKCWDIHNEDRNSRVVHAFIRSRSPSPVDSASKRRRLDY